MSEKKKFSLKTNSEGKSAIKLSEKKRKVIYSALLLSIIAVFSAVLLTGMNKIINADERNKTDADMIAVMKRIFPAEEYRRIEPGHEVKKEIVAIYEACDGEEVNGYCIEVKVKDHTDTITLMVAIDNEVKVKAVEIVEMSEKAGTGIKAKDPAFLNLFKGKNNFITAIKGTPKDGSQISVISGATVTSKAVTSGVNDAIAVVSQIKADHAGAEETTEENPETPTEQTEENSEEITPADSSAEEGASAQ